MKISIFGMGYVGAVSAVCLANEGYQIIGVDPVQTKVDMINCGQTPIIEKDVGVLIKKVVENGFLRATTEVTEAIVDTDVSFICVGTPSQLNGNLDLKYIRRVCEQIGEAIKAKKKYHVVVIRSTVLPGTTHNVIIPILEESSGFQVGNELSVCNNPEFLREGTAVYDYHHPPKTVIGEIDSSSGDQLASIYKTFDAPLIRTDIETAEMVKYVDNSWHALKVGFTNEIGNICKSIGADGHKVMNIFCQDTKLNLSSYYMKPGFAFGGSCLPKDLRALIYKARGLDLDLPILNSILHSNTLQTERGLQMVMEQRGQRIGVLGFSFKAGTDDLRESPVVEMIERLLGKGYDLKLYDKNINLAKIGGTNRDFILNIIPHISKLMMKTIDEVLDHAETVVIGNSSEEFRDIPDRITDEQVIVDLVRISDKQSDRKQYYGICW